MRLYKYRDLSDTAESSIQRLSEILHKNAFWCARPSSLNDETEFIWDCNYEPTNTTVPLLTDFLVKLQGRTPTEARAIAQVAVLNRDIEPIARPVFDDMIKKCRQEIGLLCFGTSNDNKVMWQRYAGNGNGVCIEIDVPEEQFNKHLFLVEYPPAKVVHIDQLLAAFTDPTQTRTIYSVALLSKTPSWAPEKEIRFVSSLQNVSVHISGSVISNIILGPNLAPEIRRAVKVLVESLPYHLPLSIYEA